MLRGNERKVRYYKEDLDRLRISLEYRELTRSKF